MCDTLEKLGANDIMRSVANVLIRAESLFIFITIFRSSLFQSLIVFTMFYEKYLLITDFVVV